MSWWWTTTHDHRVQLLAAGFGFGPRVAAEVLAHDLGLCIDPWRPGSDRSKAGDQAVDIVLNFGVAEPGWADTTARWRIWVDCLMWLRRSLPKPILKYDLILAENFFETRPMLRQVGPDVIDVQPLVDVSSLLRKGADDGPLAVSFGGIETPYTCDAHRFDMPYRILSALAQAKSRIQTVQTIICHLPSLSLEELAKADGLQGVEFRSAARSDFLSTLTKASRLVVQPGLYGPFEAFGLSIPLAFTFPMSYTQMCQVLAYAEWGILGPVPLLERARAATEPFDFDVEAEELNWFTRSAEWWQSAANDPALKSELSAWAQAVITGEIPPRGFTERRSEHFVWSRKWPTAAEVLARIGIFLW